MSTPIRIAIADDHPIVRAGLVSLIQLFPPCQVVADAANGKELIDKLALLPVLPDICILDISMPVMNGYNAITLLKSQYPSMKFLILTMMETEFSIITMIKSGANGYLLKGGDTAVIVDAIKQIHQQGYYYSETAPQNLFDAVKRGLINQMLTPKEIEFLCLCCTNLRYEEIAERLHISVYTAQDYQKTIGKKLNIHNRIGLALFAVQAGLVAIG